MEGSESEAIFESFDLKPQLFINEALNRVDELVDGAFDYFHQEAARLLKTEGTDRSEDLKLGINYVRHTVQSALDKRLSMWEQYCLHHCFATPGFSLPSANEISGDDPMDQDDVNDEEVDAQLDLLRRRLAEAGKECAELNRELQALERRSAVSNQCVLSVNKALELYDRSSAYVMFQEMLRAASELRRKMEKLKTKQQEESERDWREKACDANGDIPEFNFSTGLASLKLDDLHEFITEMNI
uniref:Protein MIS12 homolog n=2 Tax=Opuntia streptacantha TaxID=393608 RepID=A0A7C8ZN51_OPUST